MGLGTPELIIIFVVALIVFGPRKLPELGRSLGKSLSEFKRASNELRNTLDDEIRLEEHRTAHASPNAGTAPPAPPPVAAAATDNQPTDSQPVDSQSTDDQPAEEPVADGVTVPRAAPELFDSRSR
jgi:TatA/E family protein of Tat protein translocase